MASIAVHAGVLGALSLAPAPLKPLPPDPEEPSSAGRGIYVHAELSRAYPIAPWIRACFYQDELPALSDYLRGYVPFPESEAFGDRAGDPAGLARTELPSSALRVSEMPDWHIATAVIACAQQASDAGWSSHGRVIVRVERRDNGDAIATATALGDGAHHEALLCCLRQAQAPVVSLLRPGGVVRFVLDFDADPDRPYPRMSIEHTASSRGSGGPEALSMLRSAFSE